MHYLKTVQPNFTKFLCMLLVSVARSSSDSIAMHYVIPVLRMTLFSYHGTNGQNQARRCLEVRQLAVTVGRQTTAVFG